MTPGNAVPQQSFGYIKRAGVPVVSGPSAAPDSEARSMAHVSAVQRGSQHKHPVTGTQTNSAELLNQSHHHISAAADSTTASAKLTSTHSHSLNSSPHQQLRSCSLTGPTAAQLNQSLRERLQSGSHSLPKQHHGEQLALFQQQQQQLQQQRISAALSQHHQHQQHHSGHHHQHQQHQQHRGSLKMNDGGSVSDTQTYVEVKSDCSSSYAQWLKHSQTAASRLSECDSLESFGVMNSGGGGSLAAATANPMGTGSTVMHHSRGHKLMYRDSSYTHSPRLNRSNSIRYVINTIPIKTNNIMSAHLINTNI